MMWGGSDGGEADHKHIGRCDDTLLVFMYSSAGAWHPFLKPAVRPGNGPIAGRWVPYRQATPA